MSQSLLRDALSLPITQTMIDRALRLARTQPPETAERAYRNAIAVLIAQDYCALLGFEADLTQSDALQPVVCLTGDIADLPLVGIGTIECRLVDPEVNACEIPLEATVDKAAYLAIALQPDRNFAHLFGFSPSLRSDHLYLDQLQSLDDFGSYLIGLREAKVTAPIRMMQWLEDGFERGWQAAQVIVETIAETIVSEVDQAMNSPELAFRSAESIVTSPEVRRAVKTIQFQPGGSVTLQVDLISNPLDVLSVVVRILPVTPLEELPNGLQCAILDLDGHAVMQVEAGAGEQLQLEFDVDLGDVFSIRLTLGEVSVSEVLTA
ncbi:MAG: DUF1822 family protein [Oscillatoriales cyanobacterium]|nr:MAG: DUF1822 family protein [Oscillatoriales cyanobacterium]